MIYPANRVKISFLQLLPASATLKYYCEQMIAKLIHAYIESLPKDMVHKTDCKRSHKPKSSKNSISIDIEQYAHELWGVNLMCIKGVSDGALLRLLGELGHDFFTKFDSYKAFCCWANVTPDNKISGSKALSSKIPKRKKSGWTNIALVGKFSQMQQITSRILFPKNSS